MADIWDDYFIEGTEVLKNNLGITDRDELYNQERLITFNQLSYLDLFPIEGQFDANHLKAVHKFLFERIYPFAGEYRNCTMAKLRDFAAPDKIEEYLNEELRTLNNNVNMICSVQEYAHFLAEEYYQLMYIHPFREGNGRSVREFLREFVVAKNDVLPFNTELHFENMDRDLMLKGVQNRYFDHYTLEQEFCKVLVQTPNNKKVL